MAQGPYYQGGDTYGGSDGSIQYSDLTNFITMYNYINANYYNSNMSSQIDAYIVAPTTQLSGITYGTNWLDFEKTILLNGEFIIDLLQVRLLNANKINTSYTDQYGPAALFSFDNLISGSISLTTSSVKDNVNTYYTNLVSYLSLNQLNYLTLDQKGSANWNTTYVIPLRTKYTAASISLPDITSPQFGGYYTSTVSNTKISNSNTKIKKQKNKSRNKRKLRVKTLKKSTHI